MKNQIVGMGLLLVSAVSWAQVEPAYNQEILDADLQREILAETPVNTRAQGMVIIQPAQPTAQVVTQPTTYVEAAPLVRGSGDEMRRKRQEAELATEQKIVERLEKDRMEDERRRSERIFGAAFGDESVNTVGVQAQTTTISNNQVGVVAVAPQQVVPQPVVEVTESSEIVEAAIKAKSAEYFAMGGSLGLPNYSGDLPFKIDGDIALGVTGDYNIDRNFAVTGGFTYSKFEIQNYGYSWAKEKVDQYNMEGGGIFYFTRGTFQPYAGGVLSYTYRKYKDSYGSGYGPTAAYNSGSPYDTSYNTSALDFGIVGGADVKLSRSFSLGGSFKYYMNIDNWSDSNDYWNQATFTGARYMLQETDYWILSVTAKARF
ncbi:MAG: porin family protein [Pseudobdellovibrionaceae bacterium]|nr:porin family protein [Bdellovibrionales bacterium]USN48747.1 MAG: porin family protein [Pseudobdellovibrionaceae bacterium]